jgi:hypothetical protein
MSSENWSKISKILNMGKESLSDLLNKIRDKSLPSDLRCAALDRYTELEQNAAAELLTAVAGDLEEPEDLRVVANQWLRNVQVQTFTRGTVRTRGAATAAGMTVDPDPAGMAMAEDPSPRVGWLSALPD